ncbi:hypothetical protein AB0A98_06085 [Streptomyces chrestomyceticus]|uniref:hypothetical protein n=1 Tax=Streptomyces chrestomyceticus TaxID=68185 RepID=UPI0033F6E4D0
MRCSTIQSTVGPGDEPCLGTATHLLIGSLRTDEETREPFRDPVCKPCGESYTRRPALRARIVPLRMHMPESAFIEIIEGHRLVKDPEHEARCFDCGTTGSPTWFRFQTNGCSGRPESIEVLYHSRDMRDAELHERAAESARLWWDYAVDYLHTHVEDWRVVTGDPHYSAYFTFRDREYGVRHDLPDFRFGAEKLPNRGRPAPARINLAWMCSYKQAVFHFYGLVNRYENRYFATYTPGREDVILHAPEGQTAEVLRLAGLPHSGDPLAEVTDAVCDAFGAIADITFQQRIYGEG